MAGTWALTQIATYPVGTQRPASVIVGDYIYCFGGKSSTSGTNGNCYKYHIPTQQWTTLPSMVTGSPIYGATTDIVASYDSTNNQIVVFCAVDTNSNALVKYIFNVSTDTFVTTSGVRTADTALYYCKPIYAYAYNGVSYVVAKDTYGRVDILTYNFTSGVLATRLANVGLEFLQTSSVFFTCLDKIIMIPVSGVCYQYNITTNMFSNLGFSVPYVNAVGEHVGAGSWSIGSKGYIYGGVSGINRIYDFNTQTWAAGPLTTPTTFCRMASVVSKGNVYLMGGSTNGSDYLNPVKQFSYFLDKPSNVTAQYIQATDSIQLNWTDNTTEETSYVVERKADNESAFTQIASIPVIEGTAYSYTDADVDILNHSYQYKIKARLVVV